MMRTTISTLTAAVVLATSLGAQERDFSINYLRGARHEEVALMRLHGDSLYLEARSYELAVALENIRSIEKHNGSHAWTGAAIGGLTGVTTMAILLAAYPATSSNGGDYVHIQFLLGSAILGAGGALVGAIVGSHIDDVDEIDLSGADPAQRRALIAPLVP